MNKEESLYSNVLEKLKIIEYFQILDKAKVYSFIDFTDNKSDILTYFDIILGIVSEEGPLWDKYKTMTGTCFVNEIRFENGTICIPECFVDIHQEIKVLVIELLKVASLTITDGSTMIPIQLFLCYYRNGKDVCPMHDHKCRQITLSIGKDRLMTVDGEDGVKKMNLYNGSVIYLHREKHGILKEDSVEGNRLSLNLFYTTSVEMDLVQ